MTLIWNKVLKKNPPWNNCCYTHDKEYWAGGTRQQRLAADLRLRRCVEGRGHPYWALLMFYAVRLGGHPRLPLPWRWGYGWKKPYNYSKE